MRKLECPLSHNKQHHQQKQQAERERERQEIGDSRAGCARQQATGNWQHVAEQQFMMLPLTGECCLQLLLMTMMIPRMHHRATGNSLCAAIDFWAVWMAQPEQSLARAGPWPCLACQHLVHPIPPPSTPLQSCLAAQRFAYYLHDGFGCGYVVLCGPKQQQKTHKDR